MRYGIFSAMCFESATDWVISDNIMASWAAKYAYTKVLPQENIFIHELQNQHLHAKTTVIDDH